MKIRKNKVILFACSFFFMLIFIVLSSKFFYIFQMPPSSWEEIIHFLPLSIICSLIYAAWITWGGVGDELLDIFSRKNKKDKKE